MPLQNRVDPFGQIHGNGARGLFTGNRGIIHNPDTRTLLRRRWTTKSWIICALHFKDRPARKVMSYNRRDGGVGWTELFFLDEVTALAAGHRPCFECRREQAKAYAAAFGRALAIRPPGVQQMDAVLHSERLAAGAAGRPVNLQQVEALPDGSMISANGVALALRGGVALRWNFAGYSAPVSAGSLVGQALGLITPPATVAALRAGFRPAWHPTAQSSVA